MSLTDKNFIGKVNSGASEKTFTSKGTGEIFTESGEEEINEVVHNAYRSFILYRNISAELKVEFLERIKSSIESQRDILSVTAQKETSLPEKRLHAEIVRTINQIQLFIDLLKEGSWVNAIIDTAQPDRLPLRKIDLRQMQIPMGVIGIFGAGNFPFAFSVAGGDTISALVTGCAVVYKSHPGHPSTSRLVAEIIINAASNTNMPGGIFSLIHGNTHVPVINLVKHPLIKAIAFTGSFAGGKALLEAAAKRPETIPVYAEMGSTNPVFILPEIMDQKGKDIAQALAASNILSTGQFCTNPGIIVSKASLKNQQFLNAFSDYINENALHPMLTDSICQSYISTLKKIAAIEGVRSLAQVKESESENLVSPAIFITTPFIFAAEPLLKEEVFGPCSIHIIANEESDFMKIAEQLTGQLTITIWGTKNDFSKHINLMNYLELKAGRIICNDVPTGVEVTHAMMHGGPFPATSDSKFTSVGTNAVYRFTRPVCYQNYSDEYLPQALQNKNVLNIRRKVNGKITDMDIRNGIY